MSAKAPQLKIELKPIKIAVKSIKAIEDTDESTQFRIHEFPRSVRCTRG